MKIQELDGEQDIKMDNKLYEAVLRIKSEGEDNWKNISFRINQEIQMGNDYGTSGKLFKTTRELYIPWNKERRGIL